MDVMKKYGAIPYVPGQKIHVTLTEDQLMTFDKILRDKKGKRDKTA